MQSTNVDGVQISIVKEGHGGDLRLAMLINGCQPSKPLALQVLQFVMRKRTHRFISCNWYLNSHIVVPSFYCGGAKQLLRDFYVHEVATLLEFPLSKFCSNSSIR